MTQIHQLTAAVIGGDRRYAETVKMLRGRIKECRAWKVGAAEECRTPEEALDGADVVLLPMPVSLDGAKINCMGESVRVSEVLNDISLRCPGAAVFGGRISPEIVAAAQNRGILLTDFVSTDVFAVRNAVPTAEGAVYLVMQRLGRTICGCRSAVIGYGNVGKALARLLVALGAEVTVAARKTGDRIRAEADGCRSLRIAEEASDKGLSCLCVSYDVILNTVPFRLFGRELLEKMDRETVLIDLAGVPGGFDRRAAEELGLNPEWALALPARYAPVTAGCIVGETILDLISEGNP